MKDALQSKRDACEVVGYLRALTLHAHALSMLTLRLLSRARSPSDHRGPCFRRITYAVKGGINYIVKYR